MADDSPFHDLICRVRTGDQQAAEELVLRYEPAIRRTIRARLRDARLRRLLDSTDVCQSVLGSFFVRAALGRYELARPEDLLQLLTSMAHHKLTNEVHRQRAARRDHRRLAAGPVEEHRVVAPGLTPSEHVAAQDLLQEARRRLSPEALRILTLREQGCTWDSVATQLGAGPEVLRKRLEREIDHVCQSLGLDETGGS